MNLNYIFILVFVIYFVTAVSIYFLQRKLLYHPAVDNYLNEKNLNHKIQKIYVKSDNDLIGWYHKKNKNFKTLLFFHGNAGRLDNRIYKLNEISNLDLNYLIVAYRGFSGNAGKPSEFGLYKDANESKKWLNQNGVRDEDIILYGESLGTAIAIDMGQNFRLSGIILESPFTSMTKLAKKYYPFLPINLLLKDKYENLKKIKNINFPVLVMHGKKDKIVPFSMGKTIFENANKPKYSYFNDFDDHMMEFNKDLLESINSFIKRLN